MQSLTNCCGIIRMKTSGCAVIGKLYSLLVILVFEIFRAAHSLQIWQPGLYGLGTEQQAGAYYNFDHSTYFIA